MHDIEPYYQWRDAYIAAEDERSPFHGRVYDEFRFTNRVYNYYIHPQWDDIGSDTLYVKVIYVDYELGYTIIELIGEWNDCLANDIMYLKRELIDPMQEQGINKYILICENVFNFHGSDDCYYEEWYEDVREEDGWICFINTLAHVAEEMRDTQLQHYINFGPEYNDLNWRPHKPRAVLKMAEALIHSQMRKFLKG